LNLILPVLPVLPVFSRYVLEFAKFARKNPEKLVKNSQVENKNDKNNPTRSTRNNPVQENDLFVKPVQQIQSAKNPHITVAKVYNKR
jgi:hypothetical protein